MFFERMYSCLVLTCISFRLKTKTKMDTIEYSQLFKRAGVAGIVNEKEVSSLSGSRIDVGGI